MVITMRNVVHLVIRQQVLGMIGDTLEVQLIKNLIMNCPFITFDGCCWKDHLA